MYEISNMFLNKMSIHVINNDCNVSCLTISMYVSGEAARSHGSSKPVWWQPWRGVGGARRSGANPGSSAASPASTPPA